MKNNLKKYKIVDRRNKNNNNYSFSNSNPFPKNYLSQNNFTSSPAKTKIPSVRDIRKLKPLSKNEINQKINSWQQQGYLKSKKEIREYKNKIYRKQESNRRYESNRRINNFLKNQNINSETHKSFVGASHTRFKPHTAKGYQDLKQSLRDIKKFDRNAMDKMLGDRAKDIKSTLDGIDNVKDYIESGFSDRTEFYYQNKDLIINYNNSKADKDSKEYKKYAKKLSEKYNEKINNDSQELIDLLGL